MSESFPRGNATNAPDSAGGSSNNQTKTKGTKRSLSFGQDELFGASKRTQRLEVVNVKKGANFKKKKSKTADNLLALSTLGIGLAAGKSVKYAFIERLNLTKYVDGSLALGYILQISDNGLVVSLPGGLTGTVNVSEISDICHELVSKSRASSSKNNNFKNNSVPSPSSLVYVHMPVRCFVLRQEDRSETSKKKKIVLSLRSSLVNRGIALKHMLPGFPISGCIASKEDRGYIVSTGVSSMTAFLPFKGLPPNTFGNGEIVIGQPIECLVDSVNQGARTVSLRAQKKAVAQAITRGTQLTFNTTVPGMLLNVNVEKVVQTGLMVSYLGLFHGTIDSSSLPRPYAATDWQKRFSQVSSKLYATQTIVCTIYICINLDAIMNNTFRVTYFRLEWYLSIMVIRSCAYRCGHMSLTSGRR